MSTEALDAEADGARGDDQDVASLLPEGGDRLDETEEAAERDAPFLAHDDVRPRLHDDPPGGGEPLPGREADGVHRSGSGRAVGSSSGATADRFLKRYGSSIGP